ncbi:hypothetical protein OG900_12830 [Streptomyces sp. NBC_00433]
MLEAAAPVEPLDVVARMLEDHLGVMPVPFPSSARVLRLPPATRL